MGGTSGIGLAIARMLKKKGEDVTVAGRRGEADGLPSISVDLVNEDDLVTKLSLFAEEAVDALIYSAACFDPKRELSDYNYIDCQNIYTVNVYGLISSLKALYPSLKKNKGRVIVLNSVAGRVHSQTAGILYTSSKYALSGLVRQLSKTFATDNVLINSIFLGPFDAGMSVYHLSNTQKINIEQQIPLKRLGCVEDIFPVVNFLLDSKNVYMTGAGIDLNGGLFVSA